MSFQKRPRGQAGRCRRQQSGLEGEAEGVLGWTRVTLETLNVHSGKEPRPWTESRPHLGQVERQSPGGGIFKVLSAYR